MKRSSNYPGGSPAEMLHTKKKNKYERKQGLTPAHKDDCTLKNTI